MTQSQRPLCFILMPFGQKPAAGGAIIDFDAVYQELISPAIGEAGLEPLRADAVRAVQRELGDIAAQESGVVVDLFLSYRTVNAWQAMVDLVARMPPPLAATVMVQEQLALALNRAGRSEDAERVLTELLEKRGPSSETHGILGRVYKDRWEAAAKGGNRFQARGFLDRAI